MDDRNEDAVVLLENFGRLVAGEFDSSIRKLERRLNDDLFPASLRLRKYLASLSERERAVRIGQEAIEIFLHELMAAIEESDVFRIDALSNGKIVELKEYAENGLHAEQLHWIDEFSENERISEKLV